MCRTAWMLLAFAELFAGCPKGALQPRQVETQQQPAATGPAATTTAATTAATGPANGQPRLSLSLSEMTERTGDEFGLAVPMLLLTVKNVGNQATEVPQLGVDLIVSLRLDIEPAMGGPSELRAATLLRPWTVQLAQLPPGGQLVQALSPLSVERRDVPLAPGRYQVRVCVPPAGEAKYASSFTATFGGQCSLRLPMEVVRRRRGG